MILGAIALLLVALVFVAAELFVPSHGVLAVFAALAAIGSVVMAARASAMLGVFFGTVIFLSTPVVFYLAIRIYPKTAVGKKVLLNQEGVPAEAFLEEQAALEGLVGQVGVAMTMLRPAGSVEVGGRVVDAMSDDAVIEAGTKVEVVTVTGMRVMVKAVAT